MRYKGVFLLVFLGVMSGWHARAQAHTLYVPVKRSELDLAHDYHIELLKKALHASGQRDIVIKDTVPMLEGRALRSLEQGTIIDIYWMGADQEKEQRLRKIPIPTTRGLIGFRQLLVHRDQLHQFDDIDSRQALTSMVACQGHDWPDTLILRHAGVKVVTTSHFEDLFSMLNSRRCDFFPRAVHDVARELEERQHRFPELVLVEGLMIHYRFAVYFYTNKNNEALAAAVEQGLALLSESGEFDSFMQQHPLTRGVFPLSFLTEQRVISLANPFLGEEPTPDQLSRYWIAPPSISD